MRLSASAVINVQGLSKAIVDKAVTAALEELRGCQTVMGTQVNGKLDFATTSPKDTIDFKNGLVNGTHEPEMVKVQGHSMMNGISHGGEDSDDSESSVTSDSDSDASDSSEPSITTFRADGTPQSSTKKQEMTDNPNNPNLVNEPKSPKQVSIQGARTPLISELANGDIFNHVLDKKGTSGMKSKSTDLPPIPNSGNSSGSSDVIFGQKDGTDIPGINNEDLGVAELNHSAGTSGHSDSKDENEILAELQKIVEEDQLQDSSSLKDTKLPSGQEHGGLDGIQNTPHKDGNSRNSTESSYPGNAITSNNHYSTIDPKFNKEAENHDDGDDSGGLSSYGKSYQDNSHDDCGKVIIPKTYESDKPTIFETNGELLPSLRTKESFEKIERKLQQLEVFNTEQSSEIKRLQDVNESLKTKFSALEETSDYHQKLEDQMLKKNEELEKHLLGLLKSQDIIYDLREKMRTVTEANEKLTKDYQEAVKALEAVDKLFNQKDDLVKKWKDATEESRKLVELLKKHNADIADIETVDKLKEDMTKLEKEISKAQGTNKEHKRRNEELEEQSKIWMKKYELENEERIKLNHRLDEAKKEMKNNQKLAAKRGRKNQILHLEVTELKDMLKLAKDKTANSEMKVKDLDQKLNSSQEMYTNIIHEKEKQHSTLLRNSEVFQKDIITKDQMAESLRTEIENLKTKIGELESDILATVEKLTNSQKELETSLKKQEELNTSLEKVQSELEKSKIEKVDNDLYIEEQTMQIKELGEQCRDLQEVVKQFIFKTTQRPRRRRVYSSKPMSQSMPAYPNLEMYKKLLAPPKTMRSRPHPVHRETRCSEDENGPNNNDIRQEITSSVDQSRSPLSRPRSTYGNRELSLSNRREHEQSGENTKDWLPNVVLVDSKKLDVSSTESGVSADQYAMEYVKVGDRVLIEMPLEGRKQNIPGLVKYVGPVYHKNFKVGIYAGLRLDVPVGDTSGTLGGRMYFHCLPDHGKFIKLSHILAIQNKRTQQYTRIFPLTKSFSGKS